DSLEKLTGLSRIPSINALLAHLRAIDCRPIASKKYLERLLVYFIEDFCHESPQVDRHRNAGVSRRGLVLCDG
ncbi:MAG TPA: hypothetical protein VGY66_31410, partial [Gemmataceae bacterium]|nr:hypothetical protein [Gemmataceae bacterium]